jgi:hypothetical protein
MSGWGFRVCAACGQNFSKAEFSQNQWSKGVGASRCEHCVYENVTSNSTGFSTARNNNATLASIDVDTIIGEGAFRYVAKGQYSKGQRSGQPCVSKWFKAGEVYDEVFFAKDILAVDKALDILTQWNQSRIIDSQIRLNRPEVWRFVDGEREGQRHLVEPFIENYTKFNSNTGWTNPDGSPWSDVMQAISHYSYHASGGQFLLCDLQGGLYRNGAVLSDPVIHSRSQAYGLTDLGDRGISSFFSNHRCNQYCNRSWTMPRDQGRYFVASQGTSMILPHAGAGGWPHAVPPLLSRPLMTGGGWAESHAEVDSDSDSDSD